MRRAAAVAAVARREVAAVQAVRRQCMDSAADLVSIEAAQ